MMIGEQLNKKGLSPLVATILLIAFAVSLGTLIMSWSIEAVDSPSDACKDVQIQLQQVPGGEAICYDTQNQRVNFLLKNTGQTTIDSLVLRVIDVSQELSEKEIQTNLESGGLGTFEILYETVSPNNLVASITPQTASTTCIQEEIEVVSVPLC